VGAAEGALAGRIACVDLETTGGHAARDRIIEAGVVLLEDGAVVEEYSTLVNPGVRIPYAIQEFTGISEAMVADAPPFSEVADAIAARIDGRLFVAHNARFDYGFLRSEFRRLGRRFRAPVLCTVRLSRALTPDERGHNLDAVMARHGIACEARHRALGDARVLADFLRIARERWPADALSAIVTRLIGTSRLPPQLDPSIADELPEGPGVYLFFGENDALLYVGKAKNLASRVPAHFSDPHAKLERELTRLVRRIEWIETCRRIRRDDRRGTADQGPAARAQPQPPQRLGALGHHAARGRRDAACLDRDAGCTRRSRCELRPLSAGGGRAARTRGTPARAPALCQVARP
jgi:DNA polymerase-3 subunit epsilon